MAILHINFKGTEQTADGSKYSVLVHMLDPLGDVKTFFSGSSHVVYQIKGTMQANSMSFYTHP